jgi:hypothetical protein
MVGMIGCRITQQESIKQSIDQQAEELGTQNGSERCDVHGHGDTHATSGER